MVSLTNNSDGESDTKPDSIEEPPEDAKSRISGERGGDGRSSGSKVIGEARVSEMELDSEAPGSEVGPRVSEEARVRGDREVSKEESDEGEEKEAKESEVKIDSSSAEEEDEIEEEEEETAKNTSSQFNSLLSEFDDFVANEKSGQMATSRALRYGFEVGDLVWGKVKSHPWWPGHIFNDEFASPQVRRTRREGHVLVAFLGDSSYGWFDPAEFIPFDANFAEKSKQTSSRNFTKAVEEAVDEVCRRRGLGLACKCRNPYSFRPMNVQGYFGVDVPDYEPRSVYSAKQIQKARDSFKPREALSFIKNLALSPCVGEEKDLEFVKNRATVVAYRKAVFEEFDVTYAQAFGVQPGRPAANRAALSDQTKQPPLAPLSGPLVIAETLGGGKSATKEKKAKDVPKKDKYLLKRRDESSNLKKAGQVSQGKTVASAEGSVTVGNGDFLLQKRSPETSVKPDIISNSGADSSSNENKALVLEDVSIDTKPLILDKVLGKGTIKEAKEESGSFSDSVQVSKGTYASESTSDGISQSLKAEGHGSGEFKHEESQHPQSLSTAREDLKSGADKVLDGQNVEGPSPTGVKRSSGAGKGSGVRKTKVKRPREEPDVEITRTEGKKKKKKQQQLDTEMSSREPQKHSIPKKVGSSAGKKAGKAVRIEQSKRIAANTNSADSVGALSIGDFGNEIELPRILSDLQVLALDPFHGTERSSPTIVRKFFLRFRSIVFQKSLAPSPPSDAESLEPRPSKSSASIGASDNSSAEPTRELPSTKPARPSFRSEDPTISGRKRSSSDRQEDIAAKRSKKVDDIRNLAAEKKSNQKTPEAYRGGEGRESAVPLGRRTKQGSTKKSEPPARAVDPTMLVMKFPPKTSLPSPAELKARFARFGPIDQTALRVFWKSSTCRIVFQYKSDAEAACKYAAANSSLFGSTSMKCFVKEYGPTGNPDPSDPGKLQGTDDGPAVTEAQRSKDSIPPGVIHPPSAPLPQSSSQLKSCLKKSSPDEPGPTGGGGNTRGTSRVKFMLAGEESTSTSKVEPSLASNRNNNNSGGGGGGGFGDGGALIPSSNSTTTTTSVVAMDFSVRNIQKTVPLIVSPLPPILPLPPQFAKTPLNNTNQHHHHRHHHSDGAIMISVGPRNSQNPSTAPPSSSGGNSVDISQQMLSLLSRCNDVVTNVTGLLGYVPYHPL